MHVSLLIQVGHKDGEPNEVGFEWNVLQLLLYCANYFNKALMFRELDFRADLLPKLTQVKL